MLHQIAGRAAYKRIERYHMLLDLVTSVVFRAFARSEDGMPALHSRLSSIKSRPTLTPVRHVGWPDFALLLAGGVLLIVSRYTQYIDQILESLWTKH